MSERSECRLSASDILRKAEDNNFNGEWAIVAVAAALFECAAAAWEVVEALEGIAAIQSERWAANHEEGGSR